MDRIEAELQAIVEAREREAAERKDEVLGSPVELFQALTPQGMTISKPEEIKLYELLGLLTQKLNSIETLNPRLFGSPANYLLMMAADWADMLETAGELSELIETAVEEYIEEDHGE